jgi:Na+/H+ antiporter NhaD/arsenite permease-like protein
MRAGFVAVAIAAALIAIPEPALAASLDGARMSLLWALPFVGILLSIAAGPLLFPHAWERHLGKFAIFWSACVIVPLLLTSGYTATTEAVAHTLLLEYIPFILLLLALFVTAGGIYLEGNLRGTPAANTLLLLVGACLASFVGTTGASMIMIRPLIRANDDRIYRAHTVIFFIFLVSNIGGSLTPLGDPPLFVGFLKGVDFLWTTTHLFSETLFVGILVLAVFFIVDWYLHRKEAHKHHPLDPTPLSPLRLHGTVNIALIGAIIAAIVMSAEWKPSISFTVAGVSIELQNLVRDVVFVIVVFGSLGVTSAKCRQGNAFTWGPIREVAVLFACIFICLIPMIAMLRAGHQGAFGSLLTLVSNPDGTSNPLAYFWITGGLSSFLDNAPTYLVFFELAGGDPQVLMTTLATTLAAISTGAVFMGANTYIGNAPNFMVYAIARDRGVPMPSFFAYMIWSGCILIPIFLIAGFLFFH